MATKAHSTLTGSDLHEPKGVAAASAYTLYAADGAGSGSWGKLTANNLTGTGNPFGGQLLHVREEQTSGTASQVLSAATWNKRTLNTTKTNEITSATLTSSVISLPAGTYFIDARCTATQAPVGHAGRLQNTTAGTTIVYGTVEYSINNNSSTSQVRGRFTLSGTSNLELQHYTSSAATGGLPLSAGTEVYSDVLIWKVG